MTTKVTIEPAGHAVLVSVNDNYTSPGGLNAYGYKQEVILSREHGGVPKEYYITDTRNLDIRELPADDPIEREARGLAPRAKTPHPLDKTDRSTSDKGRD